ncbi:MAG: hypothetical protein HYV60_12495 [Planctomycetia bacterium]|nr:hypothetical protein [Planctomycetia bacterium]
MESNLDDHRPGLKPPRFSLATLFFAVALLGVLFAAMNYLGSYAMLLTLTASPTLGVREADFDLDVNGKRSGSDLGRP